MAKLIDIILETGSITIKFAKTFAESEFEKYHLIQGHLFSSDFDRFNKNGLLSLYFKPNKE